MRLKKLVYNCWPYLNLRDMMRAVFMGYTDSATKSFYLELKWFEITWFIYCVLLLHVTWSLFLLARNRNKSPTGHALLTCPTYDSYKFIYCKFISWTFKILQLIKYLFWCRLSYYSIIIRLILLSKFTILTPWGQDPLPPPHKEKKMYMILTDGPHSDLKFICVCLDHTEEETKATLSEVIRGKTVTNQRGFHLPCIKIRGPRCLSIVHRYLWRPYVVA